MTPGIKKFTDALPGLCYPCGALAPAVPDCPATGKYNPLGVPEVTTYNGVEADEYVIGLVQYRTSFSSSLPLTLVRGYVQNTACTGSSSDIHLMNEFVVGDPVDTGYCGVTSPQYLGPIIAATKDKPVRIIFRNLLPTNAGGELFLPADATIMGSGEGPMPMAAPVDQGTVLDEVRNPMCSEPYDAMINPDHCLTENRATGCYVAQGCFPTGSGGPGDQCEASTDCQAGLDCFYGEGNSFCVAYCDVAAPQCGLDQQCYDAELAPYHGLGICF